METQSRSSEPREQRCEACGSTFGCGAEVGVCWCDDPRLDPATLARLRATYDLCLCPACLLPLAEAAPSAEPASGALEVIAPAASNAAPRGESR